MPAKLTFELSTLLGFVLVLARVAGVFVFVPLPGLRTGPELPRVVLAVGTTLALYTRWPQLAEPGLGLMAGWLIAEAAFGLVIGLAVAVAVEGFQFAAQMIGLQAGYAYASSIDPTTEADSSVLIVFAQLVAGLLFFALGVDREIVRVFARSLEVAPPGAFHISGRAADAVLRIGSSVLTVGFRLALPVVAMLVLVDIALALAGRVHAQLQLLTLAFPVKMLAGLVLLASVAALVPRVFRTATLESLTAVRAVLGL